MPNDALIIEGISLATSILSRVEKELERKPNLPSLYPAYVAALMVRSKDLFSASIELVDSKNTAAAKVLLRTLTETYVLLHGCIVDRGFADQIINTYWNDKKRQLNRFKSKLVETGLPMTPEQIDVIKSDLDKLILPDIATLRNTEEVFRRFNLSQLYHQIYTYLSSYTHTDPLSLDEHVDKVAGELILVRHKSLNAEALLCLRTAMSLFTSAFSNYAVFGNYNSNLAIALHEESEAFGKKMRDQQEVPNP